MLAGDMFTVTAWVGLASGIYLLAHHARLSGMGAFRQTTARLILLMVLLDAIGQFILQPLMAELKSQAYPHDVMQGALAVRFGMVHGIAQLLHAAQSLLGIALVLKTSRG